MLCKRRTCVVFEQNYKWCRVIASMPSLYFSHPVLSEKLLRNRYQTEYLQKFCNDSKSVLYGHRQVPEHVWLEKRPVGSPSFRVDRIPTPTYLRPPFASRLSYYDKINNRKEVDAWLEKPSEETTSSGETLNVVPRSKTARPKQSVNHLSYSSRPLSEQGHTTGFEAISKMTLGKYRERNYENMIGPRVFFRPTIPPRRHDYVIHPAFHSEAKRAKGQVRVKDHDKKPSWRT